MANVSARSKIVDVAAAADVSKSTVSLAFNAPHRVAPETLERIRAVAKDLGYNASPVAQSLKTGHNNLFGFISGFLNNPHGGAVLEQVQHVADAHGYLVITAPTSGDTNHSAERSLVYLRKFAQLHVRAVLIQPLSADPAYVAALRDCGVRLVTYGNTLPGLDCDHVGLDNRLATRMLTGHLIEHGHRRIGHIAGTLELSSGADRLAGVEEGMSDAGLTLEKRWIGLGDYSESQAYAETKRLLGGPDKPTALVAANNITAISILRAIRDLGLRCPEDVSLVAVDLPPWGDLMVPEITCAAHPVAEIARQGALWTIENIKPEDDNGRPPRRIAEFAPELVLGTSVAPPSRSD